MVSLRRMILFLFKSLQIGKKLIKAFLSNEENVTEIFALKESYLCHNVFIFKQSFYS